MAAASRNRTLGWKLLRERYQQRGLVLALGAGVSTGCNLPSWPELLCRRGEECFGSTGRALVEQLIAAGTTLPVIAGILESKRPKGVAFLNLLSKELYRDFPFHEVITNEDQRRELVKFVQESNPTMRSVTALCARKVSDTEFVSNEMVRAVVNFNVDSVLRTYVRARYGTYLFHTIESASKLEKVGRIPIYHMHGFLKFYRSNRHDDDEEVRCVFTEGEYYDFFNRPNSVFNYTFLYLLREFNCLFLGMSMTDENVRRLLHYSTSEHRQRAMERGVGSLDRIALRHFAILKRSGSTKLDELTDIALRRLGTRVPLITAFAEIPQRLAYVYGEEVWADVY
jgi:hypothetical protein